MTTVFCVLGAPAAAIYHLLVLVFMWLILETPLVMAALALLPSGQLGIHLLGPEITLASNL